MYASELYEGLNSGWTSCQIVLFMSEIQKESPNTLILSNRHICLQGVHGYSPPGVWQLQGEGQIPSLKREIAHK